MATPLPITDLPGGYGNAGVNWVWTPGDNTNGNQFQATGAEILLAYNSDVPTQAVWHVNIDTIANGGTFTLTYAGQTTSPALAWNANGPTTIQAALNALLTAPAGGFTVVGNAPNFVVYGPVGVLATALTGTFTGLTAGSGTPSGIILTDTLGGAGVAHSHTIFSVADVPFNRPDNLVESIAPGVYKTYQMFPTSAWAQLGNIAVTPASNKILYLVLHVPS